MSDITYWNKFYNNDFLIYECSDFCKFVMNFFQNYRNIEKVIDCGTGNGRDSFALSEIYEVHGVDNSGFIPNNKVNLKFSCDDFVTIDKNKYDLIYSRFTFHSITNENHETFLNSVPNGKYLAIETRSSLGENEYVHHGKTHFRNYTDINYLKRLLTQYKFEIMYINEGNNMAKYKNENPICIRVICRKKNNII